MRIPLLGNITFAKTKPPLEQELAQARIGAALASIWSTFQPYSDDLTGAKGLNVYAQMKTDAQVQAALNQVYGLVLGEGWDIQAAEYADSEADPAQEQADFVKYCFEQSQGSFTDNLLDILDAVAMGWSVSEIVWRLESGEPWDGYYGLKALKSKDVLGLELLPDEFGNVQKLRQANWLNRSEEGWPPEKFVIFTNRSPYSNPFGQSDLRAAHKAWWLKDWTQRWFAVFMQRSASPTPYGTYKAGTPKAQQDAMLTILNNLQSETGMVIPQEWAVSFLQVAAGSQDAYLRCLEWCDNQIAKAILSQTLTSGEGQRVGSMALGNVHLDVLQAQLRLQRERLCECVNDQLIRRLVDANFETRLYPKLIIVKPEQETTVEYADALFKMSNLGLDVVGADDVPQLRDRLGLTATPPEPTPDLFPGLTPPPVTSQDQTGQTGAAQADATTQAV
jgi:phage gp29-like protein